jgi:hypothetical protein
MKRFSRTALLCVFAAGLGYPSRADEKEAKAVIDKAITAMGGEEKLSKVKAFTEKGKGTITLDGSDIAFTFEMTAQGVERYRSAFQAEVDGNKFDGATVLDGDKGWRKLGEDTKKLEGDDLADEKRNAYIDVVPILMLPLKGKGFKVDSAADEKVGDKPAAVVVATGPDKKQFTIYFDKESGLPIRLTGRVVDSEGKEFTQDTTFEDYKEFGGIKVATKSRSKRDGEKYVDVEGIEFEVLDEAPPGTFAEPK